MSPNEWAAVLYKIAEQQLRRQNVNAIVLLLFGQRSCPEPALHNYLDAYVMGEPLPYPVWRSLVQRLRAAGLSR